MFQKSRESRIEIIDQRESEMLNTEKSRMKAQLEKVKNDEHHRNRSRVAEIWTYVDRVQEFVAEEEEKLEPSANSN